MKYTVRATSNIVDQVLNAMSTKSTSTLDKYWNYVNISKNCGIVLANPITTLSYV